jgi:hypothetical protein
VGAPQNPGSVNKDPIFGASLPDGTPSPCPAYRIYTVLPPPASPWHRGETFHGPSLSGSKEKWIRGAQGGSVVPHAPDDGCDGRSSSYGWAGGNHGDDMASGNRGTVLTGECAAVWCRHCGLPRWYLRPLRLLQG